MTKHTSCEQLGEATLRSKGDGRTLFPKRSCLELRPSEAHDTGETRVRRKHVFEAGSVDGTHNTCVSNVRMT